MKHLIVMEFPAHTSTNYSDIWNFPVSISLMVLCTRDVLFFCIEELLAQPEMSVSSLCKIVFLRIFTLAEVLELISLWSVMDPYP